MNNAEIIISALPVGYRAGPYTVVAQTATKIAISDSSGAGLIAGNRNHNPCRRWYNHSSKTLAARLAHAARDPEAA